MRTYSNQSGFTLIELAIVLVIIGMLIGLGANMVGPMTNFVKVRETRDVMDANLQSIISWASSRNTIPHENYLLPDDPNRVSNVIKSPLDAWGQNLVFMYYSSISRVSPTKDTVCGRRTTGLQLVTVDPDATINNVAFVILSGAENLSLKSTLNGSRTTHNTVATYSPPITTSYNPSLTSDQRTAVIPRDKNTDYGYAATGTIYINKSEFDSVIGAPRPVSPDLVRWVTLDELRSKIGCQGAPLKILNNELPYGKAGAPYSATFTADGGVPPLSWCIEAATAPPFSSPPYTASCKNSWTATANPPVLSETTTKGTYSFTVYVKDSDSNEAQKQFVLTVNPP